MVPEYIAQLFFIDREQLDKIFKNKIKEKDSQLEINFEKANAEAEQDEIFSKMTKNERKLKKNLNDKRQAGKFAKMSKSSSVVYMLTEKYNRTIKVGFAED